MSIDEIDNIINKKSGVLGISGVSSDFRDLEDASLNKNQKAKLALEIFCYKIAKYIGSYMVSLDGADAIIFTAGIGENCSFVRETVCGYLDFIGVKINKEKNNTRGKEIIFSEDDSKIKLLVIPTNEELMIARKTKTIIQIVN
jgi:acetate kinase